MTARPPGRDEPSLPVARRYRLWGARHRPPGRPAGHTRHGRQHAAEYQRAQVSAVWALLLGRFREYLHTTASLNDDLHNTLGGPHDTGP